MIISKIIEERLGIKATAVDEVPVETLGLSLSKSGLPMATFVEGARYMENLSPDVVMVITSPKAYDEISKLAVNFQDLGFVIVENPRNTFFKLHNCLTEADGYVRPTFKTVIGENCKISKLASIAENNVVIGDNVTIEEFVVIRENTIIGDNSVIRAGVVIGGEGFEFKKEDGKTFGVVHRGGVDIGENVEIQYNSCVDKAIYPWDDTVISPYCRIDDLVYIAHAVKMDEATMVVATSGIGGRVEIGPNSWVGLGAAVRNGIKLGSHSRANMGAVVTKSVEDGDSVSGNFAISHEKLIEKVKQDS